MKQIIVSFFSAISLLSCTSTEVIILNSIEIDRVNETVQIPWERISLKGITPERIIVLSPEGNQIASQIIYDGTSEAQSLIFQASVPAQKSATYIIKRGRREKYPIQAFGRFVPERADDFAWENNRIAHRIYGPALEATGELSNGIDVWLKRTEKMVINHWYDLAKKGEDYHVDRGEGVDNYKVGRTLGAGAMAPFLKDSLWLAHNFTDYKVLDNGPLRISFEVNYAPFLVDTMLVTEKRTISLDANTSFTRITELFSAPTTAMNVAAGIVCREEAGEILQFNTQPCTMTGYWEPENGENGTTGLGIIFPEEAVIKTKHGHLLLETTINANKPFTYLTGAGWSKSGFPSAKEWAEEISFEALKFHNPLKVTIK